MENLTNAINAVTDREAIDFKNAIVNELSVRLYNALNDAKATVANDVIGEQAIEEKVEIDGRTAMYRNTVTRIEQARKMRDQKTKVKEVTEEDDRFNGLYDDGSGRGATIPKPIDNPNRYSLLKKESIQIDEDNYAEAVGMQNGKYTMKEADLSPKQKEYRKFFDAALKKFGVKSPSDFSDDSAKKKFFNYIQKNWKG